MWLSQKGTWKQGENRVNVTVGTSVGFTKNLLEQAFVNYITVYTVSYRSLRVFEH